MSWVGKADLAEHAMESMAELHRFAWGETCCVGVDEGERVVNDSTGASVTLWDDTQGRDPQAGQRPDLRVREDNPKAFGDHVGHLNTQKDFVFFCRGMATTGHGVVTTLEGPGLGREDDRCTVVAQMLQKAAGRMWQRREA
jgi:hypothetical protein